MGIADRGRCLDYGVNDSVTETLSRWELSDSSSLLLPRFLARIWNQKGGNRITHAYRRWTLFSHFGNEKRHRYELSGFLPAKDPGRTC